MGNEHAAKIMQAWKDGTINKYMAQKLMAAVENGITEDLCDDLIHDGKGASSSGVNSDKDYAVYFFVNHLSGGILDDTFGVNLEPDKKQDMCHYIMTHKDDENYKFDDLTDYRLLIHKWLCDRLSKKAYPNIAGKETRDVVSDVDKWIETLKEIYASIHSGISRVESVDKFTSDWDSDERFKFVNWMKYYEDGNTEKYNVKTAAFKKAWDIPESWVNKEQRADDSINMSTVKKKNSTKREKELDKARAFKSKMRSRLRSFKRLIERYNDILPKHDMESVYDELYSLEKSISKLDVYASMQDCVIRSANKISKFGFSEGSDFLHKVANEPMDLPQAPPAPPAQTGNVQPIISRLEALSQLFKTRDIIRELASIDILLSEMGMGSYFPEISEAQAKLIEAFGYSSNKVDPIISKLRGSGGNKADIPKAPAPKMPENPPLPTPAPEALPPTVPVEEKINTEELMTKPVGKVEKKLPTR